MADSDAPNSLHTIQSMSVLVSFFQKHHYFLLGSEKIPEALLEQLAPGGRMIIPIGPQSY
jgi:hypothetical protein